MTNKIFVTFIMFVITIMLFVGCEKPEKTSYELWVASEETTKLMDRFRLSDDVYTSTTEGYNVDVYSTYYSVKILKELSEDVEMINCNNIIITDGISSLINLRYATELYNDGTLYNLNSELLEQKLSEFVVDGVFTMYGEKEMLKMPDTTIFAILNGLKCIELLDKIDIMIEHRDDLVGYLSPYFEIKEILKLTDDFMYSYSLIYQMYRICEILQIDRDIYINYLIDNYERYQNTLNNMIEKRENEAIFELDEYFDIMDLLDVKNTLNVNSIYEFITNLESDLGGYTFPGDNPNPLIMYIVCRLSNVFNIDINKHQITSILNRHKCTNGFYIQFVLFYEDPFSSYYAFLINEKLGIPQDIENIKNLVPDLMIPSLDKNTERNKISDIKIMYGIFDYGELYELQYFQTKLLTDFLMKNSIDDKTINKLTQYTLDAYYNKNVDELNTSERITLLRLFFINKKSGNNTYDRFAKEVLKRYIPENLEEAFCYVALYKEIQYCKEQDSKNFIRCISEILDKDYCDGMYKLDPTNNGPSFEATYYALYIINNLLRK